MNDQEKDKLFGEIGISMGIFALGDVTEALKNQKIDEDIGSKKPIGVQTPFKSCQLQEFDFFLPRGTK